METIDYTERKVPQEMSTLQEDYRGREMNQMRINLNVFQYHLEDNTAVGAIVGDDRIELVRYSQPLAFPQFSYYHYFQHIMGLSHLLLERFYELLQRSFYHGPTCIIHPNEIEDLAISSMVAYLTFEKRMHDLMRGWRLQGRDIDQQLGRFADGLFQDIQREVCLHPFRTRIYLRLALTDDCARRPNAKRPSRGFVSRSLEGPERHCSIAA